MCSLGIYFFFCAVFVGDIGTDATKKGAEEVKEGRNGTTRELRKKRKRRHDTETDISQLKPCRVVLRRVDGEDDRDQQGRSALGHSTRVAGGAEPPVLSNHCIYACLKCGREVAGRRNIVEHQKVHCPDEKGRASARLRRMTRETYHDCRLCSKKVLLDLYHLFVHLKWSHETNLTEYRKLLRRREGAGTQEEEEEVNKDYLPPSEEDIRALRHNMLPAYSQPTNKRILPPQALPMDQTTFKVANICTFRCLSCHTSFDSLTRTKEHKGCRRGRGYEVIEARYHTCCLCSKRILCDRTVIKRHVGHHRSKTWQEYLAIAARRDVSENKNSTFGLEKELEMETQREMHLKTQVALIRPPLKSMHIHRDVYLPEEKTTRAIAFLCLYQCTKCNTKHQKVESP